MANGKSGKIRTRTLPSGRVVYYAQYYELDGSRVMRATKARNEQAAYKWLGAVEARIAAGKVGDPKRPKKKPRKSGPALTVDALCLTFYSTYEGDLSSAKDYRRAAKSVLTKHVLPTLGKRLAVDVTRRDIIELVDGMQEAGKSAPTISKVVRQLHRVFNWAVDRELIPAAQNPCSRVPKPRCREATDHYTVDEVTRLLTWAVRHDRRMHALIALAFYVGLRKGELAALDWADYDVAGARIVVSKSWKRTARKSGKPVTVNVNPHLAAILAGWKSHTGATSGPMFSDPTTDTGQLPTFDLWGIDEAIKAVNAEAIAAGSKATAVRRFAHPWHAFRHSHGTFLASQGANLGVIRDALGQSTLQMASRYTHISAQQVAEHVAKLPALGPLPPEPQESNVVDISSAMYTGVDTDSKACDTANAEIG